MEQMQLSKVCEKLSNMYSKILEIQNIMSVAIPHFLDYASAKPSDIGSYMERYDNQPINGASFACNQTTILNVGKCGDSAVLDPITSRFQFTVHGDKDMTLCNTAASFIKSVQVWFGSQILENLNNFDCLFNALFDSTVPLNEVQSQYNITLGALHPNASFIGETVYTSATSTRTYSLSLLSTIVGSLSKNYIPLYLLNNGNIQIRITWNDANACAVTASATTYTFTDVKYIASIIYLKDEIISRITTNPVVLFGEMYNNCQYVIPADATAINQLITAPYSSLKTVYITFREVSAITTRTNYTNSRGNLSIVSYYFQIGSKQIPPSRVICAGTGYVEPFCELASALHCGGGLVGQLGTHSLSTYSATEDIAGEGSFVLGCNFESHSGKANDLISGVNTRNSQLVFNAEITSNAGIHQSQMDCFLHADCTLVISDGVMTIMF